MLYILVQQIVSIHKKRWWSLIALQAMTHLDSTFRTHSLSRLSYKNVDITFASMIVWQQHR